MKKILVNDGIHPDGKQQLEAAGFQVDDTKVPQEELAVKLPEYDAIVVRSATKVRKDLIDGCPKLQVIARGGVGLDNIDHDYAREIGRQVINTPAASSKAVAELAFAHLFSIARSLHLANREMPLKGDSEFGKLKKSYSKGFELQGKTIGIIGFGRIGQETARIALGLGMKVIAFDLILKEATIEVPLHEFYGKKLSITISVEDKLENLLNEADVISLHVPFTGKPVLSTAEFNQVKKGAILINASRGGTVDEEAMLAALESGNLSAAGLDVFENEPTPKKEILQHPKISLTPHIGASTGEAQRNIGMELAEKITAALS